MVIFDFNSMGYMKDTGHMRFGERTLLVERAYMMSNVRLYGWIVIKLQGPKPVGFDSNRLWALEPDNYLPP